MRGFLKRTFSFSKLRRNRKRQRAGSEVSSPEKHQPEILTEPTRRGSTTGCFQDKPTTHGRARASTLATDQPSQYCNVDVKTEERFALFRRRFRKNRRGGICADNVQDYYRSWDTRSKSF